MANPFLDAEESPAVLASPAWMALVVNLNKNYLNGAHNSGTVDGRNPAPVDR